MNSDKEIRDQFKSKFDDFKVSIPDDGWDRIEKSLNSTVVVQNLHVRRVWRIVGSVAAVAILIFGSLLFLNIPFDQEDTYISESVEKTNQLKQGASESDIQSLSSDKVQSNNDKVFADKTTGVKRKSSLFIDPIKYVRNEVNTQDIAIQDRTDIHVIEDGASNFLSEEIELIVQNQNHLLAERISKQNDDGLVLSIGGKGGLTTFYQTVNSPMTLRSASISSDIQLIEESEKMLSQQNKFKDNIAEMEHNQPVSFGLTVSKTLIDGLYLETGLVYSYLYSRSKNTSTALQNRQTQSLHYLGIPLNINYNLFNIKNLNVYTSVGGMIEKDVYGRFSFSEEGESQTIDATKMSESTYSQPISQRNPQLSVNAGLGLSYPLYKDLKLYGKIGGAYYFDAKNDYKTIYSDSKIVMDLSIGIRYEFK